MLQIFLFLFLLLLLFLFFWQLRYFSLCTAYTPKLATQHLAPAARRRTQIDCSGHIVQQAKLLVELQQFERGSRTPPLFFGQSVEH